MNALKKILLIFLQLYFYLVATNAFAFDVLPPEKAFQFSTRIENPQQAVLEWQIAKGYFLYAKKLHLNFKPELTYILPQGEFKYQNDSRFEVYKGLLTIPIEVKSTIGFTNMRVSYQGCSQNGFCYPPIEKNFLLNFENKTITEIKDHGVLNTQASQNNNFLNVLMTDQNQIQKVLNSAPGVVALFLFASLGILLAFTPCVLPMIPILTSIILGQQNINSKKALLLSSTYVIGSASIYAIAGLIAVAVGHSIQIFLQTPMIISLMSAVFIFLALSMFDVYELRLPSKWQHHLSQLSNKQKSGKYLGVFVMGMLSTLIVSPCVTAPLVGVLIYISGTGNMIFGASALFAMGIGMGIPLILLAISAGKFLPRTGIWMVAVKKTFGFLMIGMAIWLLSRILSTQIMYYLWGIFILLIAFFIAFYLPRLFGKPLFLRSIGLLVSLIGVFIIIVGISPDFLIGQKNLYATTQDFKVIHNVQELNSALLLARNQQQPVLLDFYADWCESCVSMDKNVFNNPVIKKALKNYVLLRADLSNNDAAQELILKSYSVVAPPTVLFFTKQGSEINSKRIVGEIDYSEFLNRLQIVSNTVCQKNKQC